MDARELEAKEVVPASRKLGRESAAEIIAGSAQIIVAKGKKLQTFSSATDDAEEIITAMLGATGNLRAPTIRAGKTTLVGFNEETYRRVFG